jgi:hypothetical protein
MTTAIAWHHQGLNMEDIHTKVILEIIYQKMMDFICRSDLHIDEFYKSLNREELDLYANESKRIGDLETYHKLRALHG